MKSEIESQDSNDKMESPETDSSGTGEKTGEKSIRQKRDSTISFRVSRSQRERIESLADLRHESQRLCAVSSIRIRPEATSDTSTGGCAP